MNLKEKHKLYSDIKNIQRTDRLALQSAIDHYASIINADPKKIAADYHAIVNEADKAKLEFQNKISEAIEQSKMITEEMTNSKVPLQKRKFENWEHEIINLAYVANPNLSGKDINRYLAELLPHRTAKAYEAFGFRNNLLGTNKVITAPKAVVAKPPAKPASSTTVNNGKIVDCEVVKLLSYGAILRTTDGRSGLLHKSQIVNAFVHNVADYLYEGQSIKAKLMQGSNGRLNFSTRGMTINREVKESTPTAIAVEFKVADVIDEQISTELKKRYRIGELPKIDDLPAAITTMINDLEKDKDVIQNRINILHSIKDSIVKMAKINSKFDNIKKYFVETDV